MDKMGFIILCVLAFISSSMLLRDKSYFVPILYSPLCKIVTKVRNDWKKKKASLMQRDTFKVAGQASTTTDLFRNADCVSYRSSCCYSQFWA